MGKTCVLFFDSRCISAARARPQQQTRRPPLLLSIDGTDRRTLDRFMTLTAHNVDRVINAAKH